MPTFFVILKEYIESLAPKFRATVTLIVNFIEGIVMLKTDNDPNDNAQTLSLWKEYRLPLAIQGVDLGVEELKEIFERTPFFTQNPEAALIVLNQAESFKNTLLAVKNGTIDFEQLNSLNLNSAENLKSDLEKKKSIPM